MGRRRIDIPNWISALAALTAVIVSIVIAVYTTRQASQQNDEIAGLQAQANELARQINLDPGRLIVHEPTEYCIARGFRSFPSDHIILPVTLENTGAGAKTIERLALFFEDTNTAQQYRFILEGYSTEIDSYTLGEKFEIARAVTVPERTLQRYVFVFHIDHWWDTRSTDYNFQFRYREGANNTYSVRFGYFEGSSSVPVYWQEGDKEVFLPLTVYGTINNLALRPELADYVNSDPTLAPAIRGMDVGTYNVDCFSPRDFPAYPTE